MKHWLYRVSAGFLAVTMMLTMASCAAGGDPEEQLARGLFVFSKLADRVSGSAVVGKNGIVFDGTARTPCATVKDFTADITGKHQLKFMLKNTSDLESMTFSFLTEKDTLPNGKSVSVPLEKTSGFTEVLVDMNDVYGFLYTLTQITLETKAPTEGELIVRSLEVCEGTSSLPVTAAAPETYMDFKQRTKAGIPQYPDGLLGFQKAEDGKLVSFGSYMGKLTMTTGTPEDPFAEVVYTDGMVDNVDRVRYSYASIAQVVQVPGTDILVSPTHLEHHIDATSWNGVLGLSVSRDGGKTWTLLGEIIRQEMDCDTPWGYSHDIGNGELYIDDEYVYIYSIDWSPSCNSISVARCATADFYAAIKEGRVPEFRKKYNGQWEEPGLGGRFDPVMPQGIGGNFGQIVYCEKLQKYLFFMTARLPGAADADICLFISDDLADFTAAKPYAVSPTMYGQQYPTVVDATTGSQFRVGDTFYLYYCQLNLPQNEIQGDWLLFWGCNTYTRQTFTISK